MYQIDRIAEEMKMVKAMLKVLEAVPNKERFVCSDIPAERRRNYYKPTGCGYMNDWHDFTGASLSALVERGFLEVLGTEDYIYTEEDWRGKTHKRIGERKIYKVVEDVTFEDYKQIFAELLYKKILTM
jgi:hypothetical protein